MPSAAAMAITLAAPGNRRHPREPIVVPDRASSNSFITPPFKTVLNSTTADAENEHLNPRPLSSFHFALFESFEDFPGRRNGARATPRENPTVWNWKKSKPPVDYTSAQWRMRLW
jgi:hypothetical protein